MNGIVILTPPDAQAAMLRWADAAGFALAFHALLRERLRLMVACAYADGVMVGACEGEDTRRVLDEAFAKPLGVVVDADPFGKVSFIYPLGCEHELMAYAERAEIELKWALRLKDVVTAMYADRHLLVIAAEEKERRWFMPRLAAGAETVFRLGKDREEASDDGPQGGAGRGAEPDHGAVGGDAPAPGDDQRPAG